MTKKRLDYEILRLVAIFGVVFNHTQNRGFELFRVEGCSGVNFYSSILLGILCKVAVPLFLMISGGLLLHRDEPIRTVLFKRVLRIFMVLVLFSGVEYLCRCQWGYIETPGFRDFLSRLWSYGVTVPYWYLYCYLGLMLMLPLLRPMVRGMRDSTFVYLILLHIVMCGVLNSGAIILGLGAVHEDLMIPMVESSLFYFIVGYYFAHRFPWESLTKKKLAALWGMAAAAVAVMFCLAAVSFRRYGYVGFSYLESLSVFPIFSLYLTVCYMMRQRSVPAWLEKLISTLGSCVFGVYLLEGILRHYLDFVYTSLRPVIHVLPACLVWVAAVVLCGLGITWVMKKIPGLKALL